MSETSAIEPVPLHLKKPLVWDDWVSQMQHAVQTLDALRQWIDVTPDEEAAIEQSCGKYAWSITPYYASLMDRQDAQCPIRLRAVPSLAEFAAYRHASVDPVGDRVYRKTNRVVHRYPDRVIVLTTDVCPVYCRHGTRKCHTTDLEGTYLGVRPAIPGSRISSTSSERRPSATCCSRVAIR